MRHILFYITYFPAYGGIEKVTCYLANYLVSHDFKVSILSFCCKTEELKGMLSDNVDLFFVPNSTDFLSEENVLYVRKFLETNTVDKIIYQDCYSPIHDVLFRSGMDVRNKLIVCEHNSPICQLISYDNYWKHLSWGTPHDFIRKIYYPIKKGSIRSKVRSRHRLLLEKCDKYILLSDRFKGQFFDLIGSKSSDKVLAVHNPITLDGTKKISVNKRKQALFVGRLVEDKGINYLVEIWRQVEASVKDWKLVIVGDGPMKEYIEAKIVEYNLKNVYLEGARMNVADYYDESSIFLMTSIFEGFPLVLTEAMSRGVVPFAFNSYASLPDIIDDEHNGFMVDPYDVQQYVVKLTDVMTSPIRLSEMAGNALLKSDEFSIDIIGNRWINILTNE